MRIAIIDHSTNSLYVDNLTDEILEKFDNDIDTYILETYCKRRKFKYSWTYIYSAEYFSINNRGFSLLDKFQELDELDKEIENEQKD